jgi:hypothetical protein
VGKPQVIIIRKDKRVKHKFLHLLAFGLTGGTSGIVTAAKVASDASYNARTRKLQAQSEEEAPAERNTVRGALQRRKAGAEKLTGEQAAEYRAEHVPTSREYRERHP